MSEIARDMTPEPCTTQARRLRHYSANLSPSGRMPGRVGRTLCNNHAKDEVRANYGSPLWSNHRVAVADLPDCKLCARRMAALRETTEEGEVRWMS